MKKNILAVAVAGALIAPLAMADAEVYGTAHVSAGQIDDTSADGSRLSMHANNSNVGVRGGEDLGGGLKAEYQVEVAANWDDGSTGGSTGLGANRDTFVGFAGDWGQARVGRANSPFKNAFAPLDPFADTAADYNNIMGVSANSVAHDTRISNAVWYNSPNMSGFSGSVMYGLNDRVDTNKRERSTISVGGSYKQGPVFVGAAYDSMLEANTNDLSASADGSGHEDDNAWRVGGSYTIMEATTIGLAYESVDAGKNSSADGSKAQDRTAIFASLTHKIGATTLALTYAKADKVADVEKTGADQIAVGVMQALSKNTTVYAQYAQLTSEADATNAAPAGYKMAGVAPSRGTGETGDKEASGFLLGVIHKFSSK